MALWNMEALTRKLLLGSRKGTQAAVYHHEEPTNIQTSTLTSTWNPARIEVTPWEVLASLGWREQRTQPQIKCKKVTMPIQQSGFFQLPSKEGIISLTASGWWQLVAAHVQKALYGLFRLLADHLGNGAAPNDRGHHAASCPTQLP